MPAKKGKRTNNEDQPEEQVDPQEAAFERLSTRLTSTFEQGFEKLQQALVNMAPKPAPEAQTAIPQQQTQDPPPVGYNTRNKALRPLYNPPVQQLPVKPKPKKQTTGKSATARQQKDAMDVAVPEVTHTSQASAHHLAMPNVNILQPSPTEHNINPINEWIVSQATNNHPGPSNNTHAFPTSVAAMSSDATLEAQVQQVLRNTATHLAKGNANSGFYPHKYVTRGLEMKHMGLNTLTILEHLAGIFCMIKDEAVPQADKPFLYAHVEEIIEDARVFDWNVAVRPWSEEIFSLVASGRLPGGWAAQNKIQLLRMSTSRASTARLNQGNSAQTTYQQPYPKPRQQMGQPTEPLKGGSPCINFNSHQGCLLQSGHYVNGHKVLHICAFCLWKTASANPHPECFCRNKLRFNNNNSNNHF